MRQNDWPLLWVLDAHTGDPLAVYRTRLPSLCMISFVPALPGVFDAHSAVLLPTRYTTKFPSPCSVAMNWPDGEVSDWPGVSVSLSPSALDMEFSSIRVIAASKRRVRLRPFRSSKGPCA